MSSIVSTAAKNSGAYAGGVRPQAEQERYILVVEQRQRVI